MHYPLCYRGVECGGGVEPLAPRFAVVRPLPANIKLTTQGSLCRTRTDTTDFLRVVPLPIGIRGHQSSKKPNIPQMMSTINITIAPRMNTSAMMNQIMNSAKKSKIA